MSRRVKIKFLLFLSSIYFILFYSNNQTKMNLGILTSNERTILKLREQKSVLENEIKVKSAENELYNNDVDKYVFLLKKTSSLDLEIEEIKNQITYYQSKIEELNKLLKDN